MKIEEFRNEDIGNVSLYIFEKVLIYCAFEEYVASAYRDTTKMLLKIENDSNGLFIHNDLRYLAIIGTIFLSIESYIHTILKVLCVAKEIDFTKFQSSNINGKLTKIFELAGIDKNKFYKSGIMPQLNDFQNFRNIVFHDNYGNVPNKFKHTIFNENPMKSNIIDVFQAYKVMLQVLEAFRYVFKGCDIMPDCVPVLIDFNKGPVYYEKIDKLYNDLLVPYFKTILTKHMLATDFDFEYKKFNVETTEILQEMDVRPLIKVMPNIENIKLNQQETNLYRYYIDNFTQNVIMSKDLFGIPNWHRNK